MAVSVHAVTISSLVGNDVTHEAVVAEIHPGRWFSAGAVAQGTELSHDVSMSYSLVASVRKGCWQVNSKRWGSAAIPADRGRLRNGRGYALEHRHDR